MNIEQCIAAPDPVTAETVRALQTELATAGDKPTVWLSDFDYTLCQTYTYDRQSNNHLAVIDPAIITAAAAHHLVIATSRRATNPSVPLLWKSGLLPADRAAIIENGGVIARPNPDGSLSYIDLVHQDDLQQLHGVPEAARAAIRSIPDGQELIFKVGRTMLLARLQDTNGQTMPHHQKWLASQLDGLVSAGLQVTDTRASVTIQHESVGKDTAFNYYLAMEGIQREDIFVVGMGDGPNDKGIFETADVSLGFSEAVAEFVDINVPYGVRTVPHLFDAADRTPMPSNWL